MNQNETKNNYEIPITVKLISRGLVLIIQTFIITYLFWLVNKFFALSLLVISPLCYVGLEGMKKWGLYLFFGISLTFIPYLFIKYLLLLYSGDPTLGILVVIPTTIILLLTPIYLLALIRLWILRDKFK